MSSEKTLGIVIRTIEFSESSYVATLFTEDFGKVTGLAKGARRPKSAFENALDLLAVSRVVFIRKSSDSMDLFTEARLDRRFRAGQRDLDRLYAGYYVAELLLALTDEHDPHAGLFRASQTTLHALDGTVNVAEAVMRFELSALRELGHLPPLDRCVECGGEVAPEGRVAFGQLAGGALCSRCKAGQRHVVSLSVGAMALLKDLMDQRSQADAQVARDESNGGDEEGSENSRPNRAARGELRGLMNHLMSHRLGRRPKMLDFLARPR